MGYIERRIAELQRRIEEEKAKRQGPRLKPFPTTVHPKLHAEFLQEFMEKNKRRPELHELWRGLAEKLYRFCEERYGKIANAYFKMRSALDEYMHTFDEEKLDEAVAAAAKLRRNLRSFIRYGCAGRGVNERYVFSTLNNFVKGNLALRFDVELAVDDVLGRWSRIRKELREIMEQPFM